jgi:hypothetical protein
MPPAAAASPSLPLFPASLPIQYAYAIMRTAPRFGSIHPILSAASCVAAALCPVPLVPLAVALCPVSLVSPPVSLPPSALCCSRRLLCRCRLVPRAARAASCVAAALCPAPCASCAPVLPAPPVPLVPPPCLLYVRYVHVSLYNSHIFTILKVFGTKS